MKIKLKEGFLVKTMRNGVAGDKWEFTDTRPSYIDTQVYDAKTQELVEDGDCFKRIMFVEVE